MRRRRGGVTLRHVDGVWRTEDGKYEVSQVRATTFCDGPHPERYRDTQTGRMVHDYCRGSQEHEVIIGWGVYDANSGNEITEEPDPKFVDAHDSLAAYVAKQVTQ